MICILAGITCLLLLAAGCTTTPGTQSVTTPTATSAVTAAPTTAAPSWSGTWNTTYSSMEYGAVIEVITLKQTGSSVTGTYNDGKGTINATVQEGTLTGTWHDSDTSGTYSGFFEFERSADDKSFTGRWVATTEGADALKNTPRFWNGVRVPATTAPMTAAPELPWSGTWNTTWTEESGEYSEIVTLTQTGSTVTGTYETGSDMFQGTVTGNKILGTWSEDNTTGPFEFVLSTDKNSFTGKWAYTSEELVNSTYYWNGIRV
jgi:hypothetical protein